MTRRILVSAVQDELGELGGWEIGVGGVRSAAGTAALLAREAPDEVVLVGTAGVYPTANLSIRIGEACVATRLGWASGAAELGRGYVPLHPVPLDADPGLVEALLAAGGRAASVLTVPAITTDPELVARFDARWQLEHMETWSAAHACARAGVRFAAVLGVANVVGPDAHEQYVANRAAAQEAAQRLVGALAARS